MGAYNACPMSAKRTRQPRRYSKNPERDRRIATRIRHGATHAECAVEFKLTKGRIGQIWTAEARPYERAGSGNNQMTGPRPATIKRRARIWRLVHEHGHHPDEVAPMVGVSLGVVMDDLREHGRAHGKPYRIARPECRRDRLMRYRAAGISRDECCTLMGWPVDDKHRLWVSQYDYEARRRRGLTKHRRRKA